MNMVLDSLSTVKQIDIYVLHPHPYNQKIYGNEDVSELAERIKASNWIKPLVTTPDGRIISGHRRWQAALLLGYSSVPVERRIFATEDDELEALLLENASREKTVVQKVNEAEAWEHVYRQQAKAKQKEAAASTNQKLGRSTVQDTCPEPSQEETKTTSQAHQKKEPATQTRDKVAAQVGLGSGKNYERAKKAVDTAKKLEEKGHTEEAEALRQTVNAPKSVNIAAQVAEMPEQEQIAVLKKIATGEAKTIKGAALELEKEKRDAQAQSAPSKPYIAFASWETWLPQQPMCDLLITDPPYSTDIDDIEAFANSWLPLALSKVKPTGRAYICIGAYPRELQAYLNVQASMQVQQVLVWSYRNTIGPSPTHNYKLNWQAILYFCGPDAPPLNCPIMNEQFSAQEINAPDGRAANRYHAWQKPDELAERLIRHSTNAGDTVIDCFAGTGTFLLAAHRLGRVALGCDQSPAMIDLARTRGCEVKDAA